MFPTGWKNSGSFKVRFRNLSKLKIPKPLWSSLAKIMGLGSTLPQSNRDWEMYKPHRTLRITINPANKKKPKKGTMTGSYTYGHISFYPCPRCTIGLLTQVYLHELHHVWMDQYHRKTYLKNRDKDERESERFADKAFRILGGKFGSKKTCWSYYLNTDEAIKRLEKFRKFSNSITKSS